MPVRERGGLYLPGLYLISRVSFHLVDCGFHQQSIMSFDSALGGLENRVVDRRLL